MDNDDALVAHLARDLDSAFPILATSHADRLYTIALRLLGDPADAEEVAQDALVRAYRAMAGYEPARIGDLRLRPWLASITVNLARNRRRRVADRQPATSLQPMTDAGFDPRDDGTADPVAVTTARESADELARLLLELPEALRSAVVLRHVDGLTVAETAAALGRPEGTIKAQVSRGLGRLRVLLEAGTGGVGHPGGQASGSPRPTPRHAPPGLSHHPPRDAAIAAAEVLR